MLSDKQRLELSKIYYNLNNSDLFGGINRFYNKTKELEIINIMRILVEYFIAEQDS